MTNYFKIVIVIIAILVSIGNLFTLDNLSSNYNFLKYDATQILPDILHEVSGLTAIDSNTFACIQDEKGIIFIYDIKKNKILHQYSFNMDGDYEGIAKVGNSMYVLRSDGFIFEIQNYDSKNFKLHAYNTNIPANNNEGLCYDKDNNRLLVACKSKIEKGKALNSKRAIYGFDLKTNKLSKEPVFEFDTQVINKFASDKQLKIPGKPNKKKLEKKISKKSDIKFRTSAIAIHPVTKQLYLLSAIDHLLFIFNSNGKLEHIQTLDPDLFVKAEGITFLNNNDILITNEGQNKKPTLYRFNYLKKK